MDLIAVNIFIQVVESRSFTEAATVLNMTKSTVSRKVSELELHLGVRLITRSTRSLMLTPEGEQLYQSGTLMLDMMSQVEVEVSASQSLVKGLLNIVMPVEFGQAVLDICLCDFLIKYPHIKVNLDLTDRPVDLIAEGIDLYVKIGESDDSSLVSRYLTKSKRFLVASPAYLQKFGAITSHLDLALPHKMIELHNKAANIPRSPLILEGKPVVINVPTTLKVNTITASLSACLRGLGITVLPEYHCSKYLQDGTLIRLLPDYEVPEVPISLIYAERKLMPKRKKVLIDYMLDSFEKFNKASHFA